MTHDQREALELGDRVAVMNQGRFEQIDAPPNVYDRLANEFVARFIGRANSFSTRLGSGFQGHADEQQFEVMSGLRTSPSPRGAMANPSSRASSPAASSAWRFWAGPCAWRSSSATGSKSQWRFRNIWP